jgi:hypothetical protein
VVLDARDGGILATHHDEAFNSWTRLALAGRSGELLVEMACDFTFRFQHSIWNWQQGPAGRTELPFREPPQSILTPTRDGEGLLLFGASDIVEWRHAATGALVRRLRLPRCYSICGAVAAPDGHVLAVGYQGRGNSGPCVLGRWAPAQPSPPPGLLRRFAALVQGSPAQRPSVIRAPSCRATGPLALSSDGHLLAVPTLQGFALYDAHSLQERVRIVLATSQGCRVAFSPDGKTLAIGVDRSSKGLSLTLWPVAHLLGE